MQPSKRRLCLLRAAVALALCVLLPGCAALPAAERSAAGSPAEAIRRDHGEEIAPVEMATAGVHVAAGAERRSTKAIVVEEDSGSTSDDSEVSEAELIHAIDIPFKQTPENWQHTGITLRVLGEPKSGTTWLARVVVELCLQLCGNPENLWCKVGGLEVTNIPPAPRYDFEMLHADTDELFLHFQGRIKHKIPGLGASGCGSGRMRIHKNGFGRTYPCDGEDDLTRAELMACLPEGPGDCSSHFPPLDPSRRRIIVIFRDARNLIISEHRMRNEVYHHNVEELEPYIRSRFKTVVAWMHQRYVWHTVMLKDISHVVFYEDLEAHPHHLVYLAAFLDLDCTAEEADDVWQRHTYANPPGDYTTYGLSLDTLEWMNTTMSRVLPEPVLARYGLTPM